MILDLIGVAEAFAVVAVLALGSAGAIVALTRRIDPVMPAPADAQAIQDAPEPYIGRAAVIDPLEALWALPAHDPRAVDQVDEHAAQAIDIIREDYTS